MGPYTSHLFGTSHGFDARIGKIYRRDLQWKQIGGILTVMLMLLYVSGCGLTKGAGTGPSNALPGRLTIATSGLPTAQINSSYQTSLSASGGKQPYMWSVSAGSLPAGVSLTAASGAIAGMPSVAGKYSFSLLVKDSSSPLQSVVGSFTLSVAAATQSLQITTANLPSGQQQVAYQASLSSSGGTAPYSWSIKSGALPVGLILSGTSGAISGTPSQTGTSSFAVGVSDAAGHSAQQSLSIQVNPASATSSLAITTTSLLSGAVGQGYSTVIQASGGTPGYNWTIASGQLPPGLQFDSSSGAIGGVPTAAGQYSFVAQVNDSAMPMDTASQSLSITISSGTTPNVGLGSTLAGGLMALAPSRPLGTNVLPNGGLESGTTGWYIPACWTVDATVAHTGSHSLRFNTCASPKAAYAPSFVFQANTSYTIGVWVKASSGSNLEAQIDLADGTDSGLSVGGGSRVAIGTSWTYVTAPDFDLLQLHNGDNIETRLVVSAPAGQTPSGTLWFDDATAQPETPLPISTFLLYPNFRGYLWQSGPQQIRLHVETGNPTGMTDQIVVQQEGGGTVNTVQQAAQASQEIDIDGSQLALGSYLIHTNLLDSSGAVVASYPDYRVTKVSDAFKTSLVNYVDTDNFLVHNGQKEFVWGVYDRTSSARCSGCMYTTAAAYNANIAGFNNMGTLANYQDTQLNAMTNFAPWSAMSPGPPAVYDLLDPAMQALQARGVGYLQTVNNWIASNQYRPNWAGSLSDPQLWQLAASMMNGKSGGLGYYTYDEPKLNLLPGVFAQYQTLRQGNPGSVTWGALITADQVYRWKDASDVIGADPYPVGIPVGPDEFAVGSPEVATTSPSYIAPTVRVSLWTKGAEQQVFNSRPVWMVLQLWRQWGQFPVYEQMKESAYKAIIGGANGIMWWGFVSAAGMEEEWYTRQNYQAYFDFKRLSGEVQALQPYLIAQPQPQLLTSVSNAKIETLVKADPKQIVIFATSDSVSSVSNVTFNLSSLVQSTATSVTVYSEGRAVSFSGNTFTDSFAPYEAHVYIIKLQ